MAALAFFTKEITMHAIVLASLLTAFVPSPETCSSPEYVTSYDNGRAGGFAFVTAMLHQPVDCDLLAAQASDLVLRANHEIELAERPQTPPQRACNLFGVGEAIFEAVDAAIIQCQGRGTSRNENSSQRDDPYHSVFFSSPSSSAALITGLTSDHCGKKVNVPQDCTA